MNPTKHFNVLMSVVVALATAYVSSTAHAVAKKSVNARDIDAALDAADALEAEGATDAAERQLRALFPHVSGPLADSLRQRLCELQRRQRKLANLRQCYVSLVPTLSDAQAQAQARYRAAVAAVELGDVHAGRQELTALIDDLPVTDGARRAFVMARTLHREAGGYTQEVDFLLGVASRLAWVSTPGGMKHADANARLLLAESLVEVGRLRLSVLGQPQAAVRVFEQAMPVARGTTWEDDAHIWLARSLRQVGRHGDALTVYERLITCQSEGCNAATSYSNSEFYDDALFELGMMLEEQQKFGRARAAYAELFKRSPDSRLLDDAAYRLAVLQAKEQHSREPMEAFVRDYPWSRHVRAARHAALP